MKPLSQFFENALNEAHNFVILTAICGNYQKRANLYDFDNNKISEPQICYFYNFLKLGILNSFSG